MSLLLNVWNAAKGLPAPMARAAQAPAVVVVTSVRQDAAVPEPPTVEPAESEDGEEADREKSARSGAEADPAPGAGAYIGTAKSAKDLAGGVELANAAGFPALGVYIARTGRGLADARRLVDAAEAMKVQLQIAAKLLPSVDALSAEQYVILGWTGKRLGAHLIDQVVAHHATQPVAISSHGVLGGGVERAAASWADVVARQNAKIDDPAARTGALSRG